MSVNNRRRTIGALACAVFLGVAPSVAAQPPAVVQPQRKKTKGDAIAPAQLYFEAPTPSPSPVKPSQEPSPAPKDSYEDRTDESSTTIEPTRAPISIPIAELRANDIEMTIGGLVLPLNVISQQEMEQCISDRIADSIVDILGSDQIVNLDMSVSLVSPGERRVLVEEPIRDEVTIAFDTVIRIQSIITTHDVGRYTIGAFNENAEKAAFLQSLEDTGNPEFANLTFISIGSSHVILASASRSVDDTANNNTTGVVLSISMAIVAVVAAIASLVYYRRVRQKPLNKKDSPSCKLSKLEHGSLGASKRGVEKTNSLDLSSNSDEEIPSYIPSEILWDYSANSQAMQTPEHSERSNSVAPSDKVKGTPSDHLVDAMSLVSGDSVNFDFDSIFRTDDSSSRANSSTGVLARCQSSLTYDSNEKELDDPKSLHDNKTELFKSLQIDLNDSNETKLLDEDDNTVEDG